MTTTSPAPRGIALGIGVILATFAALRVATLWTLPPYFDESFYALQGHAVATDPAARFAALTDGKGPLFNWLTAIPILLGVAPLTAVRLVAALATAATVLLVGSLARRVSDRRAAILAMAIYAVLPLVVVEGSMGFYEPLVGLFATAALVVEIDLARRPTLPRAVLLGLVLGGGLLTKPTGQLVLVLLPASLVVFQPVPTAWLAGLGRFTGAVALALGIAGLCYAIMAASPLFWEQAHGLQYIPPGFALRYAATLFPAAWPAYRAALAAYLTAPLVVLLAIGLGAKLSTRPRTTILLAGWALSGIAASILISSKPLARYLLPWIAPFAVLIADGLVAVCTRLGRAGWMAERVRVPALAALITLAFLPAVRFDLAFVLHPRAPVFPAYDDRELVADWSAGTGLPDLARDIALRSAGGGGVIAFSPSGTPNPALSVLLDDPGQRRFALVDVSDPRAAGARFVLEVLSPLVPPLPARIDAERYRLVDVVVRPRFGATLRLFERIP